MYLICKVVDDKSRIGQSGLVKVSVLFQERGIQFLDPSVIRAFGHLRAGKNGRIET